MSDVPTVDTLGVLARTTALPEDVEASSRWADHLVGLPAHDDIEHVVVLGVGDAGLAGDLLHAVAQPFMPVPVVVVKGYECPSFVSDATLCLALSATGGEEEVVEAATDAAAQGARVVVVAGAGPLAERATDWAAPWVALPGQPDDHGTASFGALAIPPLVVLERVGLFPGASEWIAEAVTQLERRRAQLQAPTSVAASIARTIGRTFPLVYGGGDVGAVAAARWKQQANRNAKAPAFAAAYPDLTHGELAGWGQHGDVTRQVLTLVQLRHDHEHPQVSRRAALTQAAMEEIVNDVVTVDAEGEGALAQLLDLVLVGDMVSLHLAFDNGIDPGPNPVLDDLERAVAD